jgi:hypothetical protein
MGEWINKKRGKNALEYYSTITMKKILTHATTWMNPEDIMLSELSHLQKIYTNTV